MTFRKLLEKDETLRVWLNKNAENTKKGWVVSNDDLKTKALKKEFIKLNDSGKFKNSSIDEVGFIISGKIDFIKII